MRDYDAGQAALERYKREFHAFDHAEDRIESDGDDGDGPDDDPEFDVDEHAGERQCRLPWRSAAHFLPEEYE